MINSGQCNKNKTEGNSILKREPFDWDDLDNARAASKT